MISMNEPTWLLVQKANLSESLKAYWGWEQYCSNVDNELESRIPNEATYHFGDCAGQPIFVPIEPEYDDNGNPILEKMIGYDDKGDEVWI